MAGEQEVGVDGLKLLLDTELSLQAVVPHKDAVLALAADRLADRAGMSYEHARDALAGREKLGSTGLGAGVAMPHAMSRHCLHPAVALIGLASPVDFDAPDGADVDVVLALIWPQDLVQQFLKMSATASRILIDPAMLHLVRRAAPADLIRRSLYFNAKAERSRAAAAECCGEGEGDVVRFSGPPGETESREAGPDGPVAAAPVR